MTDALLVRDYLQDYLDGTYGEDSWRSWRFSILTFAFIYMPSLNVITTTCGPSRAGKLGFIFGILMGIAGGLLAAFASIIYLHPTEIKSKQKNLTSIEYILLYKTGLLSEETESWEDLLTLATWALMWLFLILGSSMIVLGVSLQNSHNRPPQGNIPLKIIDLILFPILVPLSPMIFIFIKLLGVLKPKSQLLKHQSTVGSRAEALLESGPQLAVQLYIVLFRMSSNWNQSFSIFTSALSISISNIEHFVTARSEEFGPMSILKNICLFLPATFFKILSVSIIFLLFDLVSLAIIGSFCLLFAFGIILINCCTKWRRKEKDWRQQEYDCWYLSWLTLTNLGNTRAAALQRLFSSLYWIIVYTSTFTIFLCSNERMITYYLITRTDDDPLRVFHFKIILGLTICLGWLTLVLDVISAIIKFRHCRPIIKDYGPENKKKGFWDGFVLLEGLKYFPHCSTISNMRKIQSHL